ncbi:MAG: hypothetical protein NZ990_01330, partial [Myxococcota bacterium]|nr:hypothetical protein [Myxococcota bacterium]
MTPGRIFMGLLVASFAGALGNPWLPGRGAAEVRALVVVGASPIPIGSTRGALSKEQAIEEGLWEGVVRVARDLVDSQTPVEIPAPESLAVFWPGLPPGEFQGPLLTGFPPGPGDPRPSPQAAAHPPSTPAGAAPGDPYALPPETGSEDALPGLLSEAEAQRLEAEREAERLAEEAETKRLRDALGRETVPYTKSFRIVEDQGERPALFTSDPDVATEYVVLMEVHVEVDRVRGRLEEMGLLTPLEASELTGIRLEIRGLTHYGGYQALLGLLEGEVVAAEGVLPRNFAPGRVVVTVEGDWAPEELMDRLQRAAPENLRIEAMEPDPPPDGPLRIEIGPPTL